MLPVPSFADVRMKFALLAVAAIIRRLPAERPPALGNEDWIAVRVDRATGQHMADAVRAEGIGDPAVLSASPLAMQHCVGIREIGGAAGSANREDSIDCAFGQ